MKKLVLFSFMSLLFILGACSSNKSADNDSIAIVEETVPQDYKLQLSGNVGKYPVEMTLIVREDGTVVGQYCYTRTGSHAWIAITGVINGDKTQMQLLEKVDDKVTGDWQLKIESFDPTTKISGEMINFKDQSFEVSLDGTCESGDRGSFNSLITVELPRGYSLDEDNSGSSTSSSDDISSLDVDSDNVDWDDVIQAYDDFATRYISLLKKASKGDTQALAEYADYVSEASEYASKLSSAKGSLSSSQISKFNAINNRIAKAVSSTHIDQSKVSKATKSLERAIEAIGSGEDDADDDDDDW